MLAGPGERPRSCCRRIHESPRQRFRGDHLGCRRNNAARRRRAVTEFSGRIARFLKLLAVGVMLFVAVKLERWFECGSGALTNSPAGVPCVFEGVRNRSHGRRHRVGVQRLAARHQPPKVSSSQSEYALVVPLC